ncbi:MAG: hypothetical protein KDI13_08510 [Alphaproteobacteria bacterium]|nr:hypothetical protein [Alphaproteobacteria bacterium]
MKKLLTLATLFILTSCASIVSGDQQIVSVETPNCDQASCKLTNEQGTYYVSQTPGTVTINRSASPIFLECKKEDTVETVTVESGTKGMAFGNILAGGIIGAAVDMNTGAAYVYPDVLVNPVECK